MPDDSFPEHVLLVSPEYSPELSGGVGTHAQELALGLASVGVRVTVIAGSQTSRVMDHCGVRVHLRAIGDRSKSGVTADILEFNALLEQYGREMFSRADEYPDIIQCENWVSFPAAYRLGAHFTKPVLPIINFLSHPIENWWGQTPDDDIAEQERQVFRDSEFVIAVSNSMKRIIADAYAAPPDRIEVVHSGIDPGPFADPQCRAEDIDKLRRMLAPEGEQIVFFSGRLNPQKGLEALIESASMVLATGARVRYVVAGEADSRSWGQELMGRLNRTERTHAAFTFLGKVSRGQLPFLYKIADVAVVPSIYEPFGFAAVEAMAAGAPVIASDAGGLGEIIEHGRSGLLVPVRESASGRRAVDVQQLAWAQMELLGDRGRARRLAMAGADRVMAKFSRERMTQAMLDAYTRCRGKTKRDPRVEAESRTGACATGSEQYV